jgi:phage shock protein PspC (stress-responsive transcriptional regulator)
MKKALHISIASTLFAIEEDAYTTLDTYLRSIREHFSTTENHEDIVADIESRISEQLTERQKGVVNKADVDAVIAAMGTVADFTDESEAGPKSTARQATGKKKLYRNTDDVIVAGVCSGLGSYTNIDPLWIRLAFVLLTLFTSGFVVVIYILMAILIPPARTASQKLEMEGSPVTLETMSENIKEKVEEVRVKHGSTIRKVISWPFEVLRKIIGLLVTRILPLLRVTVGSLVAAGSIAALLTLSIFASLLLTSGDRHFDFPLSSIVSLPLLYICIVSVFLAIALPLVILFVLALSLIRRKNLISAKLGMTMLLVWCIAIVGSGVSVFNAVERVEAYSQTHGLYEKTSKTIPLTSSVHSVFAKDGVDVTYIQGATTSVLVTGRSKTIDSVSIQETDGTVTFDMNRTSEFCLFCNFDQPQIVVTLPSLETVTVTNGSYFTSENWNSPSLLRLKLDNGSAADVSITSPEAVLTSEQGSRITVRGTIASSTLNAHYGSRIKATNTSIHSAFVLASDGSRISVGTLNILTGEAYDGSNIEYRNAETLVESVDSGSSIQSEYNY